MIALGLANFAVGIAEMTKDYRAGTQSGRWSVEVGVRIPVQLNSCVTLVFSRLFLASTQAPQSSFIHLQ